MKAGRLGSGNRFANVTLVLALFIALGGTTVYAANTVGAGDIQRNAVRSKHLRDGDVKRRDLANSAVNGPKIADGGVGAPDIATGAVGTSELGDGSVSGADLAPGSIGQSHLGPAAVGSTAIADGAVTAGKLNVVGEWLNVPLAQNWVTYAGAGDPSAGFGPVQCWKDPFGIVHLRGAAEASNNFAGSTVGTLPPECGVISAVHPDNTMFAEFLAVLLDDVGTGQSAKPAWIGTNTASVPNSLNIEGALLPAGGGVSFDGVTLAPR